MDIFCYFISTTGQRSSCQELSHVEHLLKGTGNLSPSKALLLFAPTKIRGPHLSLCFDHHSPSPCVGLRMRKWPAYLERYQAAKEGKPHLGFLTHSRENHTILYCVSPSHLLPMILFKVKAS